MNKIIISGIAMLCIASIKIMAEPNEKRTVSLRVIETSDVHGHFFPYDFIERKPLKGTLARVNTYVEKLRKEYGDNLLLIDNGDILQGQPTCYYTNYVMPEEPNIAAEIINYMRYDAETMGNHDIETGHSVFDKWIREVRCPMLGANIVDRKTGQPYVRPYSIHERDGVKIAILGMITPTIPFWLNESVWSGLEFKEMVSCAKYWVKQIKEKEHADLILGLFHSGKSGGIATPEVEENATEKVAQQVPGFDIIFYGHDHTVHQEWIKNIEGDSVLCLDPSCFAQMVSDATINITLENGKVVGKHIEGRIQSVADEDVDSRLIQHFQTAIDSVKNYVERPIGYFGSTVEARDCFFGPAPFTDFIHNIQLKMTGADISFNAPLIYNATIKEGPLCIGDLFKLYRYENKVYVLNLTGKEIHDHLEMSYSLWTNTMTSPDDNIMKIKKRESGKRTDKYNFTGMTFNFDTAAGIDYEVDVTRPEGEKVRILGFTSGKPFEMEKTYRVVMNSYRGNGGGELLTKGAGIPREQLANRIVFQSEKDLRHYVMREIEEYGTVTPKTNNNWRFVPEEWTTPAIKRDRKLIFDE